MAPRSLRKLIRYQFKQAGEELTQCWEHLATVERLSEGRPPMLYVWLVTMRPVLGIVRTMVAQMEQLYMGEEEQPIPAGPDLSALVPQGPEPES